MLDIVMFGAWAVLTAYILWYLFKAKTVQPLTIDDLALTWRVHKNKSGCNSTHIHGLIKENDEIIGFKCGCGYEFIQKRLITQRPNERHVPISYLKQKIDES
jgi:hypothetical protein